MRKLGFFKWSRIQICVRVKRKRLDVKIIPTAGVCKMQFNWCADKL